MSDTTRAPEPYPARPEVAEFHVSELAASEAGASSPWGAEMQFPLPVEQLYYTHPGPADRPFLANGR